MKNIILGIDPGYGRTGWGVIEKTDQDVKYLAAGCIETDPKSQFGDRLAVVYRQVCKLIKKFQPQALSVETLYFNKNAKTVILASQARGVIVLAGVENHLPVYDYTPLQVKQALVGYGRGEKQQVQSMLLYHLKITSLPKQDDACDALAVALSHAYTNQQLK